jgi:hypothetical protein
MTTIEHMLARAEHLKRLSDNGQHKNIPGLSAGDCYELAIEIEQFSKGFQGLKLVQRNPTLKMLEEGEACYNRGDKRYQTGKCVALHVFRSMFDAAPIYPETKEQK